MNSRIAGSSGILQSLGRGRAWMSSATSGLGCGVVHEVGILKRLREVLGLDSTF